MNQPSIHPNLQTDYQAARTIGITLILAGGFDLCLAFLLAGSSSGPGRVFNSLFPGTSGLIAAAALVPIGLWAVGMGWHALRVYRPWIVRASWLVAQTPPRQGRIHPQGIRSAVLEFSDVAAGKTISETVSLTGDARKLLSFPQTEVEAEVFCDPQPKGVIVIHTGSNTFLSFRSQWHRFYKPV
ncbi:MAG: hypothetical protein K1Y36_28660 [Blastocatellia bacterium]|nr:hypothetical protein [Blastocatellia bacterium]